ncbi:hypothetical protein ARHIZOSPH14_19300 [Agromyces rhizosphaerae]|uniref:DUF2510 domain-containing protein n=1 Tax=Agromyces rhizosphaerae TaxID=88374 RepID=A0A9W6CSH6_9MICO|nr:DUF4190 domain-containing protein [Agromyces rhizosphaerae]GLI27688.1 hypothetical protein ARHIZOSPH14_19300 [Agromyces rhizosphaerae]
MADETGGGPAAGWYTEPGTGRQRWWSGSEWGSYQAVPSDWTPPRETVAGNGFAIAALVLGIWGFLTTWIPFFIGLILGAVPDLLAIIFGILGIVRANRVGGTGLGIAIAGLVLGTLAFASIFTGAGTIW